MRPAAMQLTVYDLLGFGCVVYLGYYRRNDRIFNPLFPEFVSEKGGGFPLVPPVPPEIGKSRVIDEFFTDKPFNDGVNDFRWEPLVAKMVRHLLSAPGSRAQIMERPAIGFAARAFFPEDVELLRIDVLTFAEACGFENPQGKGELMIQIDFYSAAVRFFNFDVGYDAGHIHRMDSIATLRTGHGSES
jgi:hypothetical protein